MRSIRWSALCFSLLAPLACAPHYDVGDSDSGVGGSSASGGDGSGGTDVSGGTGGDGSGGSDVSGGTGGSAATGGKGTSGGSGGSVATGGSGGSGEVGGSGGVGGSAPGGAGGFSGSGGDQPMTPSCGRPVELEYESVVAPAQAWERVSFFLFGEVRDPPSDLPDETTPESVLEMLHEALGQSRITSAVGRAALTPFMREFLGDANIGAGDTPADRYARLLSMEDARFGVLFEGDAESTPPFGLFGTVAAAYDGISQRGNALSDMLFCGRIGPPPEQLEFQPVVAGPGQTRREALQAQLNEPVCLGCHSVTDPLGFPLEVLTPDTLEYRTTENGVPIDTSGNYAGGVLEFADIESLGAAASVSCDVARCFTEKLLTHASFAGFVLYTEDELARALYAYAAPDSPEEERFRVEALLEAIVTSPGFLR